MKSIISIFENGPKSAAQVVVLRNFRESLGPAVKQRA
jgi:hypothetical protein